ncbi:SusC/RagA family TonB-linked outer membrane protein [Pseudozobellia thermophila]|uniref:TonB-linked outer membrane protein, SusC/RagA family n=1 Tax=Pseudozobellia thermophila TaxID=192903 RepID=A0A1M6GAZ5_9FLAO|nr:TonB-dependent receptor [Pseudozobellia thermophila]SHJ07027.1 TonB-linked outer membrane protein, SusC/RagA family [Pseudozobellia thermophila]
MKFSPFLKVMTTTFLLFMGVVGLYAQKDITGYVSDGKVPIPGASIVVKGTSKGVASDFDGNFSLNNISPNNVLVISSIGFVSQEIPVGDQTHIEVVLVEDTQKLDEVVLVGYTTQKKADLTGAVAVVDLGNLEKTRVPNVSQALQGQVAGVQVTASTGAPGDPVEIRIRGEGTIGNNDPLYVVDGIPSRDISFLNQADIKSISVLKDAAAAAIYGSRASGGVVLVTTKQGTKGKISFNIDYFNSFDKAVNLPNLLNSEQYINTLERAWNNTYTGNNPYTADRGRSDFADTDWLDELFKTGRSQNLQLTASGGNEKLQYLMSLGYYGQDGIVVYDNDKYQRINYRTNISADLTDRLKIGTNLQLSYDKQDLVASKGESLIRFALLRAPVIPVYKDVNDPTYSTGDPFTDMPFYTETGYDAGLQRSMYEMVGNPIAMAYFTDNTEKTYRTFGNVFGEYRFLKDKNLTFRTNIGVDLSFFHNKVFNENFGDDDGGGNAIDAGLGRQNRPNSLNESRGEAFTLTVNNTLNYKTLLNDKHSLSALVGMEYISNYSSSIGASRARFPYTDQEFRYLDYGGTELDLWNSGSASEWALFSYFGSASYSYDDRYMITANLRADASSRFAENNQWGYFPSLSAGWMISDESFLEDVDWLSNLKLRASWGILGNQEIDNYTYLTLISQENGIVKTNRFGNPDLKWESSEQVNFGIDAGFFQNKLNLTAEYFNKYTSDILLPISLPSIVGNVEPTILNAGEVRNKGLEFSVGYQNSEREFKYGINANLATLDNKVEKLHPNLPNIVGEVTRTTVGQPLNAYYGYRMEGIYQNQAEIDQHLSGTVNPSAKPGDIRFKDLNGDGIISADNDREFIGSPIPDLTFGLSFTSSYKKWDFSFMFQGVEGVDRYNDGKKIVDYDTRPFNYTTAILNAWDGENSTNSIPRVAFEDNGSSKTSSIFVEDASYVRLKNIELGYTLDDIKWINSLRLYLSGQNLLTITDYTGLDPETTDLIDKGTYPSSASLLFGLNAKF